MTRRRLISLGEQRARLLGRARVEREQLSAHVARIDASLSWIDVARKGLHEARQHPLLVALAVVVVVALRPLYDIALIQIDRCWIKEAKTPLLKTGELAESFGLPSESIRNA